MLLARLGALGRAVLVYLCSEVVYVPTRPGSSGTCSGIALIRNVTCSKREDYVLLKVEDDS